MKKYITVTIAFLALMICLPVKAQLDSQAGCGNGLYDIPCLGMVIPATLLTTPDYSLVPGAKISQKTFGSSAPVVNATTTDATSTMATSTEATTTPVYSVYKFYAYGAEIEGYGTSSEQVIDNYFNAKLNQCIGMYKGWGIDISVPVEINQTTPCYWEWSTTIQSNEIWPIQ